MKATSKQQYSVINQTEADEGENLFQTAAEGNVGEKELDLAAKCSCSRLVLTLALVLTCFFTGMVGTMVQNFISDPAEPSSAILTDAPNEKELQLLRLYMQKMEENYADLKQEIRTLHTKVGKSVLAANQESDEQIQDPQSQASLSEVSKGPVVGVTLTTCGRTDLLIDTLLSFDNYTKNDVISAKVIVDDCGELKGKSFPGWTVLQSSDQIKSKHREERIVNANFIGYKKLLELTNYKVEFIAHLEDDWVFKNSGFIEYGIKVLGNYHEYCGDDFADLKLSTVAFCPEHKFGPSFQQCTMQVGSKTMHFIPKKAKEDTWRGFSFNSGMSRNDTLAHIFLDGPVLKSEGYISRQLLKEHYRCAFALKEYGFCEHRGNGRHVGRMLLENFQNALLWFWS